MLKELCILLIFFATGVVIGLLFDMFRITRKSFKTPNIITYIEDMLFWILSGILILYVIFTFTTGEVRLYMILMIIIGTSIYFMTISKYFIIINLKILSTTKSIILFILKPFGYVASKINNAVKGKKCKFFKVFFKK